MKKKNNTANAERTSLKDELAEKYKQKHSNLNMVRSIGFNDHSHGRINYHSIGFNHEPGTL